MTAPSEQPPVIDVFAFVCELAMLALLVAAGHGLVDGWPGWALGALFATIAIAIWSQWMAPKSARRLPNPRRLIAQTALFVVTGALVSLAGWWVWGIGFAIVATATFASRRADRAT